MGLREDLKRFINTSRGRGRLDPAPERDAIGIAVSEGLPTANEPSTSGGGIASPLTEQSRTTQTVTVACDGDPTIFVDIEQATQIVFQDANGDEVIMNLTP